MVCKNRKFRIVKKENREWPTSFFVWRYFRLCPKMPVVPYRCTEILRKGGARAWHHSISKILVLFKVSESVTPFVIHSDEKMRINVSSRAAASDLWLYGCGNCFEIRDEMYTRSQKQKIMTSSSPNYMLEQSMFLLISSISPNILSSASWYALKLFHPWNSKFLHISYRRVSFQHGYDTFNSCDISTRSQAFYLTLHSSM